MRMKCVVKENVKFERLIASNLCDQKKIKEMPCIRNS